MARTRTARAVFWPLEDNTPNAVFLLQFFVVATNNDDVEYLEWPNTNLIIWKEPGLEYGNFLARSIGRSLIKSPALSIFIGKP